MPIESVVFRQINLEDDPFSSDVIKLMLESQYANNHKLILITYPQCKN